MRTAPTAERAEETPGHDRPDEEATSTDPSAALPGELSLRLPRGRSMTVPGWAIRLVLVGTVALGVVMRFVARSNLWLDEALSVNIASLEVADIFEALRHDGHPPLYYVLLHYWMEIVGEGDTAVRALSGILAVASLPLAWVAGRRLAGAAGGRWALVLVALSPYCIRYATEVRMYSLVMLFVLAGYLLVGDALQRPALGRLAGVGLVAGLLLLSHYWAFWLLGAVGLLLAWRWWRVPAERGPTGKVLVSLAAGGLLFLPWLPGFLYQAGHTGTPWAGPMRPLAIVQVTLADLGGGSLLNEAFIYGAVVVVLGLLGLSIVRSRDMEVTLDLRTVPSVRAELAVVGLTVALGAVMGYLTTSTYQSRYAAVFVPLLYLAAVVGLVRLPRAARVFTAAGLVALSLLGIGWNLYYHRTQSAPMASAVAARAEPGDVVVYCPDQLGPAYSRDLPDDLVELSYPLLGSPDRVDWVDYGERNATADPLMLADQVRERAGASNIFVVWKGGYETFGDQCEQLLYAIGNDRTVEPLVTQDSGRYYETANLAWIRQ